MLKTVLCHDVDMEVGLDEGGYLVHVHRCGDSIISTHIHDTRGMTCQYCGNGWETTVRSLINQFYVQNLCEHVHETCHVGHLSVSQRFLLHDAMVGAKLRFAARSVEKLKNEYGGGWDTPWYSLRPMDFPQASIKFGRRKRVYVCELSLPDSGTMTCRKCERLTLSWDARAGCYLCLTHGCGHFEKFNPVPPWAFRDETSTKDVSDRKVMIHAWTEDKVKEYFREFAKILGEPFPVFKEKRNDD